MHTHPVSESALFRRLKRRMVRDQLYLHRYRVDGQWSRDLGRYYASDERNHLRETHIDIEERSRELGVLKAFETLMDETS